jgi:hypothetical protein
MERKITKSLFIKGYNCPKAMYLQVKQETPGIEKPPPIPFLHQWESVELLARHLFPGGYAMLSTNPIATRNVLLEKKGNSPLPRQMYFYNSCFESASGYCKVDILVNSKKGIHVYEVKSATSVKDEHILDITFQVKVIREAGHKVAGASIIHVNKDYERIGELDPNQMFVIEDVTRRARDAEQVVDRHLQILKSTLRGQDAPSVDIGTYRDDMECEFKNECWKHIPEPSVFSIGGLRKAVKFNSYRNGIIKLDQIKEDTKLTDKQWLQVRCTRNNRGYLNRKEIVKFFEALRYPLCFLDFETYMPAIPPFDRTKPYMQIPFLYSMHTQFSEKSEVRHTDFFSPPGVDSRERFIESLLCDNGWTGSILVYNAAFEASRLKELAELFPRHAKRIEGLVSRMVDLMEPFRKCHIYLPGMNFSYSIKNVLPAMVPGFDYNGLAIRNGNEASEKYYDLLRMHPEKRQNIINDLREYCKMDTLAMVKVLHAMAAMVPEVQETEQ